METSDLYINKKILDPLSISHVSPVLADSFFPIDEERISDLYPSSLIQSNAVNDVVDSILYKSNVDPLAFNEMSQHIAENNECVKKLSQKCGLSTKVIVFLAVITLIALIIVIWYLSKNYAEPSTYILTLLVITIIGYVFSSLFYAKPTSITTLVHVILYLITIALLLTTIIYYHNNSRNKFDTNAKQQPYATAFILSFCVFIVSVLIIMITAKSYFPIMFILAFLITGILFLKFQ